MGHRAPSGPIISSARHTRATILTIGAIVLYASVVLGGSVQGSAHAFVANAGSAAAALVVATLALQTARHQTMPHLRASWAFLGGGLLVRGVADTGWTLAELASGALPITPSPMDTGYLAMLPLIFAGILLRPPLQPSRAGRRILLIDSWLAVCALMSIAWVSILGPRFEQLGVEPLVMVVALAYWVGGLAIFCCLTFALLRASEHHPAMLPLGLGLAMMALGDAAYATLVLQGAYATGHPVDVIWFAALAVIGLAATVEREPIAPASARTRLLRGVDTPWHVMVPTVLLTLATVTVWIVSLRRGPALIGVAEGALALAWLLLLARIHLKLRAATARRRERRQRVGHARAFRREHDRLRQLQVVRDVTTELTRELDVTSLLALITRRSSALVHAPMAGALLWDDDAGVLVPRAWHGFGSWFGSLRLRRGEGAAGRAIELGRGVIVDEYTSFPEAYQPLLARVQVTAALAVPIVSLGQLVGVIVVMDDRAGRTFTEADLTLLELFADQAAVAIEHARLVDQAVSAEALRELARLKSELLSTVSHELRTPLTLIHGYAELLNARAEKLTPEDVAMMADEILLGSRTMIRLVDDLLDFSRHESARLHLERRRVDVAGVLRRQIQAWRGQRGGERLRLDTARASGPLETLADPARLDQVIRNLISNALNHAPDGPVIVRAWGEAPWVYLEVTDRGPGIPDEELPRIWESLYRGERARTSPNRGSGLGLAVVRQLVELHGGSVEVESRLDEGTTFRVRLPAAPDDPGDDPGRAAREKTTSSVW